MRQTADGSRLLAQVTHDRIFFGFAKYFSGFSDYFWICKFVWELQNVTFYAKTFLTVSVRTAERMASERVTNG